MSAFLHSNIIWLIYARTLTNLFLKFLHVASVKSALKFVFTVAATASVNDPFSYLVEGWKQLDRNQAEVWAHSCPEMLSCVLLLAEGKCRMSWGPYATLHVWL